MTNIKPGSFRKISKLSGLVDLVLSLIKKIRIPKKIKLEIFDDPNIYDFTQIYKTFKDEVYDPESVFYPSCGYDGTPSKVFGDKVTYLDIEKEVAHTHQEAGHKTLCQDIRSYIHQERYDLLIILNPQVPTPQMTKHLVSGGYVIANQYHGNASFLHASDDFTLLGVFVHGALIRCNDLEPYTRTTSVKSLGRDRDLEKLMFETSETPKGLPFTKPADLYIFQKK